MSFIASLFSKKSSEENSSLLNPEAEPFYPPGEEPKPDTQYRTHSLHIVEDTTDEQNVNSDVDNDSSSEDEEDDDRCRYCNRTVCSERSTVTNDRVCVVHKAILDDEDLSSIDSSLICKYPNCTTEPVDYVAECEYADAGHYCNKHIDLMEKIYLDSLTIAFALEDSEKFAKEQEEEQKRAITSE